MVVGMLGAWAGLMDYHMSCMAVWGSDPTSTTQLLLCTATALTVDLQLYEPNSQTDIFYLALHSRHMMTLRSALQSCDT